MLTHFQEVLASVHAPAFHFCQQLHRTRCFASYQILNTGAIHQSFHCLSHIGNIPCYRRYTAKHSGGKVWLDAILFSVYHRDNARGWRAKSLETGANTRQRAKQGKTTIRQCAALEASCWDGMGHAMAWGHVDMVLHSDDSIHE